MTLTRPGRFAGGLPQWQGDTFWDDLRVAASATRLNPATTKPDFDTFIGGTYAFLFDDTDIESVNFQVQLSHRWKSETALSPHVHWSPMTADTGSVVWKFEYTVAEIGGVFGATTTLKAVQAAGGQYYHHLTDFDEIDMSGITSVSTMFICRLYRDPTDGDDDFSGDAALLEFDFHFENDMPGSREEYTK